MDIGRISAITIGASDLDIMEQTYSKYLGYRSIKTGFITHNEAHNWGAEKLVDAPYLIMQPEKSDDFSFRFVLQPNQSNYIPFKSYGWNAAEVIVENVDELEEIIQESPFEIIGPPADLSFTSDIRAMQIIGPAQEILYLTQFKRKIEAFDSPTPRCSVDQTFIVILAGKSIDSMQYYYSNLFNLEKAPIMESRIRSISKAFNLPESTKYNAAAIAIRDQCLIELDEMPKEASERSVSQGYLSPGISIVSFKLYDRNKMINGYESHLPNLEQSKCVIERGLNNELIELIY